MAELNATPRKPWVGLAIGMGLLLALLTSCFGALVFYPLYVSRPHPRSKQSEVKSNLKAAFTAEKSYFVEQLRTIAGESVGPGQPYNHVNDLER